MTVLLWVVRSTLVLVLNMPVRYLESLGVRMGPRPLHPDIAYNGGITKGLVA